MKNLKQKIRKEAIKKLSVIQWLIDEKIKNEKGDLIEFENHPFLLDIYLDNSQKLIIRKSSQIGISTMAILRSLHFLKYEKGNIIYTLPSIQDVGQFVPSKVDAIINQNPSLFKLWKGRDKNAVQQKQIGNNFIFFKGTWTEKEAIMLTADRLCFDELDKSKPEVVETFASRLGYSKLGQEWSISTPTIPDFGIDALWEESKQYYWRLICPFCKTEQHLGWDTSVDLEKEIYVCQKCHKEISDETRRKGFWRAKYPNREISGYWINRMMALWQSAKDLIKEKGKHDEQYFYNFVLGLPYLIAEQRVDSSLFFRNIVKEGTGGEGGNVMGADTGGSNHIIIGNKKRIFWIGELKDRPNNTRWQQMEELIEFFKVKTTVIDALPYTEDAQAIAGKYPYRVYLNFFKDDPKMLEVMRFGDERKVRPEKFEDEIKVLTSRNRIYDDTISALMKGEIKFEFDKGDPSFQLLIKHAKNIYARKITDRYQQEKREWANIGPDHLWTALIYWHIAIRKQNKYEENK